MPGMSSGNSTSCILARARASPRFHTAKTQKPKVSAARRVTITQREIGQMIGMSRESTNKQLRDWEERNWVRLERGGVVVLKPEALAAIAREPSEE